MASPRANSSIRRRSISRSEVIIGCAIGALGLIGIVILRWPAKAPPPPPAPPPKVVATPAPPPPPPPAPAPPTEQLVPANLITAESVLAGASLPVRWSGPGNPDDFVTLVTGGAPDTDTGPAIATKIGHTLEFSAPDEPGQFELRYIAGHSKQILGRTTVTVAPLTAEISAPSQAILGTRITVNWTGPNREGDFLTIVAPEISDSVFESALPVSLGSPVEMTVPVEPGDAEIRYLTKARRVIGRRSILITIPVTALSAPDAVPAGEKFAVRWRGPDSPADSVMLVPRGAPDKFAGISTPTSQGSPLEIQAPETSGDMELRYVAGSKGQVFARRPLSVVARR